MCVCGSCTETVDVLTSEEDRTGSSPILKHGFFPWIFPSLCLPCSVPKSELAAKDQQSFNKRLHNACGVCQHCSYARLLMIGMCNDNRGTQAVMVNWSLRALRNMVV